MKFCPDCGAAVARCLIQSDQKWRYQCTSCEAIHYQNPKVLVALYATWEDKILWIRRKIDPQKGRWAAPAGYVEEDEDLPTAAMRELYEETHARVDKLRIQLHMVGNLVKMNQVYIVYRAPLLAPEFETTDEAEEVRLFSRSEFPFDEFAYPEVADNVDLMYRDLESGHYGVYTGILEGGRNVVRPVNSDS